MGKIPPISRKEQRTPCLRGELDGFILFVFRGLELTGPTYAALGSRLRGLEQTYHREHRGKHIGSAAFAVTVLVSPTHIVICMF